MMINEVNLADSKTRFEQMLTTGFENDPSKENPDLRYFADEMMKIHDLDFSKMAPYQIDLVYGKKIFELLSSYDWFTWDVATNRGFWRYIALFVMPQCVYERFKSEDSEGNVKMTALASHFYAKWERVYPFTLFWIFKIADQGNPEATFDFLSKDCFSTDTILNVIERMGPKGFRLDIYRKILERFSALDFSKYAETIGSPNYVLRALLVEHGIKNSVYVPELCANGIDGYIEKVFQATLGGQNV